MKSMTYINNQNQLRGKCLDCSETKGLKELDKYGGICDNCAHEILE